MSLPHPINRRLAALSPSASPHAYLIVIMLVAIAPIALIMSLQVFDQVRSDQTRIEAELMRSADTLSHSVERELASSLNGLAVLAQSELFQQGRIATMARLLQGRPRADWDSVFLLERSGSLAVDTASSDPPAAPGPAMRELHRRVLSQRAPVVLDLSDNPGAGGRSVAIALPIEQNGVVRYVLGARTVQSVWQRLASGTSRPDGATAALFDAQDRLIAHSNANPAAAAMTLPGEAAASMHERDSGVQRSSDVDGREVYAAWSAVPQALWRVRVALPAAPMDAAHRQAMLAALATSGGSLLLGLLLAGWVARGGRQSAEQQLAAAERQHRENQLLTDVARQAEAASRAKDEFVSMLSHELRNRVGAISAAADVLEAAAANSPMAEEARSIIGRQARDLARRMNDLLGVGRAMHCGTIKAGSSSEGSPITVELPPAEPPLLGDGDTLPPSRRRKVLLVQDQDDVLAAVRSKLETDGHSVSTAIGGADGLSCLLKLKPEVSIVDIGLPGLAGFELARHARAAGYAGRMIALSGCEAGSDAQQALMAGFDAWLAKPVDGDQLRASLSAD